MAKKVRGIRANKPNDSFGTINSETLYRNEYKADVYKDDEEETNVEEAQEEDQPEEKAAESFVEASEPTEEKHDYKKRYDDLKRHYDEKVKDFKQREKEMEEAMHTVAVNPEISLPKSPEELEKFKQEYPDVYDVVETIASMKAQERSQGLQEELETIKEREQELKVQSAYRELLNNHPDFNEIKADEKFLTWLDEQPESISDGIYNNNTDAQWASRVVDLYKADVGSPKKSKTVNKSKDAAMSVSKTIATDIATSDHTNKKIWKGSDIAKMKPWEFEKFEKDIDQARSEGRIDLNS